jgi:hypothetical protein
MNSLDDTRCVILQKFRQSAALTTSLKDLDDPGPYSEQMLIMQRLEERMDLELPEKRLLLRALYNDEDCGVRFHAAGAAMKVDEDRALPILVDLALGRPNRFTFFARMSVGRILKLKNPELSRRWDVRVANWEMSPTESIPLTFKSVLDLD